MPNIRKGLWTTKAAADLLALAPARLREMMAAQNYRPLIGYWDQDEVKAVALKLVAVGSPRERAAARAALLGVLRAEPSE